MLGELGVDPGEQAHGRKTRIAPFRYGGAAGVILLPLEEDAVLPDGDDARDDADLMLLPLQVRALLDVKLKEASVAGVVDGEPRSARKPRFIERAPQHLRDVFATNLRRMRNAKGLSQDELAYAAEVSRGYLSQLEKGVFYASLRIVGRIADALEVDPAELLKLPGKASRGRRRES
jgi:DNA-binding XRE family transcriptional regulator